MSLRVVRWAVFGVLFTLIPIAFNALRMLGRGASLPFTALWSRGELLLISVGITANGLGELIASGREKGVAKLLVGGASVINLCIASLWYADVSSAIISGTMLDDAMVTTASVWFFGASILLSGLALYLAKET